MHCRATPLFRILGNPEIPVTSTRPEAKIPGKPGSKTRSEAIFGGDYEENEENAKKWAREARPEVFRVFKIYFD